MELVTDIKYKANDCFYSFIYAFSKTDPNVFWFKSYDLAYIFKFPNQNIVLQKFVSESNIQMWHFLNPKPDLSYRIHPYTRFVNLAGCLELLAYVSADNSIPFLNWLTTKILSKTPDKPEYLNPQACPANQHCVYIATSDQYKKRGYYYVGFTSNLSEALKSLNNCRLPDNQIYFAYVSIFDERNKSILLKKLKPHLTTFGMINVSDIDHIINYISEFFKMLNF
ncbi:putative Bro-N domain-containing protein 14 [Diachasmimorpha longicaudata entomopoxvirus]|uniref:Putative Bro-N domain-containing protein 14 n=1 Tax=Diachasmimorpha longicaudata entomopoxvirus TaxID=109981 RepID=A0A7R5WG51_9POXV|nr:putative Bro-N domain-containing protein 14 [Diachasmimorpha longicaudata entomopoxvirus]AKS26400.1 putative Bro-N domain-containing protein 14 [Diachasmimorpha longicaudata entomopoxvirus]